MSCYGPLAAWYDQLTGDVPYERFADLYEAAFARDGGEFHLLLDLCCGTGTLTAIMTRRGYELIAADSSVDMLMQARDKSADLEPAPLFLLQDAAELDLYGTVDAAFCSLDGINYLPPDALPEVFRRLHLFIRPGGLLIFDMRTPEWLEGLDGQVFVDETDDLLCLWRADYDRKKPASYTAWISSPVRKSSGSAAVRNTWNTRTARRRFAGCSRTTVSPGRRYCASPCR